jgi:hypothetical protein
MHCPERDNLIRILTNSVLAYAEAVHSMSGSEGEAFQRSRQWADALHTLCEDSREVLAAHERTHGCGARAAGTAAA